MRTADPLDLVRAVNPVPTGSLDALAFDRADDLVTRLRGDQIEPAVLPNTIRRSMRSPRRLVAAGLATAALAAGTGVAIADNAIPFNGIAAFVGISAADHAQTPQDVLDPTAAAQVQKINDRLAQSGVFSGPAPQLLPDTARLIGQLPGGHNIYVLSMTSTTATGELAVVINQFGSSLGTPPSSGQPTSVETFDEVVDGPDATPPISWGIAEDGVTAVSFMGARSEQTVPVVNNVWVYQGDNSALDSITVHYSDGTTQTITH